MKSTLLLTALLVGAALLSAGCGAGESDLGTQGGSTDPAAEMKRIESSDMPPQAKAAAKAQIEAHMGAPPGPTSTPAPSDK